MRAITRAVAAALLGGALAGCQLLRPGPVEPFHPEPFGQVRTVSWCATACTDSVDIVALGVGGFLVVPWRDTTTLVMTPPAYSNPGAVRVGLFDVLRGVRSNRERVYRAVRSLAHADSSRLSRVRAVLVGHGHYDHLMDLPTLASWLPSARVYGSSTVYNLLAPVQSALPTDSVEERLGRGATDAGASIPLGPLVSARAVQWAHAPNLWKFGIRYTIASGQQETPLERLPRSARGWKMGTALAWVVDLHTEQGEVMVRLFLHDAAAPREHVANAAAVLRTMPRRSIRLPWSFRPTLTTRRAIRMRCWPACSPITCCWRIGRISFARPQNRCVLYAPSTGLRSRRSLTVTFPRDGVRLRPEPCCDCGSL